MWVLWEINTLVPQPIKNFPAFYATWRFITAFTTARHPSLTSARLTQFTHCILFLKYPFYAQFPLLTSLQRICASLRPSIPFHNMLHFKNEELYPLAQTQTGGLPLASCPRLLIQYIRICPSSHIWKLSAASATCGRGIIEFPNFSLLNFRSEYSPRVTVTTMVNRNDYLPNKKSSDTWARVLSWHARTLDTVYVLVLLTETLTSGNICFSHQVKKRTH